MGGSWRAVARVIIEQREGLNRAGETIARWQSDRHDLLELVRRIEWVRATGMPAFCPECLQSRASGHTRECEVDQQIRKVEQR